MNIEPLFRPNVGSPCSKLVLESLVPICSYPYKAIPPKILPAGSSSKPEMGVYQSIPLHVQTRWAKTQIFESQNFEAQVLPYAAMSIAAYQLSPGRARSIGRSGWDMFLVNAQIMGLSEKGEIYPYVMGLQYIYMYMYMIMGV
jgi:hypothetical protein